MLDVLNIVHNEWEESKWQKTVKILKKYIKKYLWNYNTIFRNTIYLTPKGAEKRQPKLFF